MFRIRSLRFRCIYGLLSYLLEFFLSTINLLINFVSLYEITFCQSFSLLLSQISKFGLITAFVNLLILLIDKAYSVVGFCQFTGLLSNLADHFSVFEKDLSRLPISFILTILYPLLL